MPTYCISRDKMDGRFMLLAYAMMFTLLPPALSAIDSASFAARASIEPDAGTVAVMTSMFF